MKNRLGAVAVLTGLVMALSACSGIPSIPGVGNPEEYLKDIDPSKYVKLGDYTGLSVDVPAPSSDAAAEDSYVTGYLKTLAGTPVNDRPAKLGDTANIDFAGRLADTDQAFNGGTAQGYDLVLGSGTFIPGFEDGVVGMTIGEEKDIPLTFPETYGSVELAGKDVIFAVKLNGLTAPGDSSVQALGIAGISTIDQYTDYLRKQYNDRVNEEYRQKVEEAIRDKIESNAVFQTPPTAFLERLKESYREQIEILADAYSNAYGQAFTVSDLLNLAMSNAKFSGDEEAYVESNAIQTANAYLMMAAIAREQGISVSDAELRTEMENNLDSSGYATIEEYEAAADLEQIREQVLYDKVMDYLYQNNKVSGEGK